MKKWKVISSKDILKSKWYHLVSEKVETHNNNIIEDYYVHLENDACAMIPVTSDGKFILVKQYKHGAQDFVLEFPAGYMDPGELPAQAAERELKEEIGYISGDIKYLGSFYPEPTKTRTKLHYYLVTNTKMGASQHLDSTEQIEVITLNKQELLAKIQNGEINSVDTVAAVFLAFSELNITAV